MYMNLRYVECEQKNDLLGTNAYSIASFDCLIHVVSVKERIMKKELIFIFLLTFALLLSGCNLPNNQTQVTLTMPPTLEVQTLQPFIEASTSTPPVLISPTATPQPVATNLPEPTQTDFAPFNISPFVNNVKLRTNPGYLFPARIMVHQTTNLIVHGRSPGNEWIYVEAPNKIFGWVFGKLFNEDQRLLQAPLVEPGDVQIVRGKLIDLSGQPVSGVQFMLTQGSGSNPLRNDANTDENGEFIAFMPIDSSGIWTVAYTAISCTSNKMDSSCNCLDNICGTVEPASQQITLPYRDTIQFSWR